MNKIWNLLLAVAIISLLSSIVFEDLPALWKQLRTRSPMTEAFSGRKLADLEGHRWSQYCASVVIGLSPDCPYCDNNALIYGEMNRFIHDQQSDIYLFGVTSQSADDLVDDLRWQKYAIPLVSGVALSALEMYGVPTIHLIDSEGYIVRSWVGELQTADRAKLFSALAEYECF